MSSKIDIVVSNDEITSPYQVQMIEECGMLIVTTDVLAVGIESGRVDWLEERLEIEGGVEETVESVEEEKVRVKEVKVVKKEQGDELKKKSRVLRRAEEKEKKKLRKFDKLKKDRKKRKEVVKKVVVKKEETVVEQKVITYLQWRLPCVYGTEKTPLKIIGSRLNEKSRLACPLTEDIVILATHTLHSGFVNKNGELFTWGFNQYGQLGRNGVWDTPDKIHFDDRIISFDTGNKHSGAITELGDIYLWGCSKNGCLGETDIDQFEPMRLHFDIGHITQIVCGNQYNAVFTSSGDVYTWGNNSHGQLGHSYSKKFVSTPRRIQIGTTITKICLGESTTIALDIHKNVYVWGNNTKSQCGVGTKLFQLEPTKNEFLENVDDISCNKYICSALSNGRILYWGKQEQTPVFVKAHDTQTYVAVSHSKNSIIGLTQKGSVMEWKMNMSGFGEGKEIITGVGSCISGSVHVLFYISGIQIPFFYVKMGDIVSFRTVMADLNIPYNIVDEDNNSLLHVAVKYHQNKTLKYLLETTKDMNILFVNSKKESLLHTAVANDNVGAIKILNAYGLDLSLQNLDGKTALHFSVENEDLDSVKTLMECGASPNIQDNFGNTPLHIAAKSPVEDHLMFNVSKILVESGSNLYTVNNDKKTPIDLVHQFRADIWKSLSKKDVHIIFNNDISHFLPQITNIFHQNQIKCTESVWNSRLVDNLKDISHVVVIISPGLLVSQESALMILKAVENNYIISPLATFNITDEIPSCWNVLLNNFRTSYHLPGDPNSDAFRNVVNKFCSGLKNRIKARKSSPPVYTEPILLTKEDIENDIAYEKSVTYSPSKREVKLFISSTFLDFKQERSILINNVFPLVRRICSDMDLAFSYIDLSWGVTDEMSQDGKVLVHCLREVDSCYPFFLSLLGERYGWHQISTEDPLLQTTFDNAVKAGYEWVDNYRDRSITEIEIIQGALQYHTNKEKSHKKEELSAFFYQRDNSFISSLKSEEKTDYLSENYVAKLRLDSLKERIAEHFTIKRYRNPADIETLFLSEIIDQIVHRFSHIEAHSQDEKVEITQQVFMEKLCRTYVGNSHYYSQIHEFMNMSDRLPLIITGFNGSGKSSLLSKVLQEYKEMNPHHCVARFFTGASCTSKLYWIMMRSIINQIKTHLNIKEEIPSTKEEIMEQFSSWISRLDGLDKTFLIIIDGLDKLDDYDLCQELEWLPDYFPANTRVILSCSDQKMSNFLINKYERTFSIEILTVREKREIIKSYLKFKGKTLKTVIIEKIANFRLSESPMNLIAILEELCFVAEYSNLNTLVDYYLKSTSIQELYVKIISRWEDAYGKEFVEKILSIICISRLGINDYELIDITYIEQSQWRRFFANVEDKLIITSGYMSINSEILKETIAGRYDLETYRRELAFYFSKQEITIREAKEIPYLHLANKDYEILLDSLCNIDIVEALYTETDKFELVEFWKVLNDVYQDYDRIEWNINYHMDLFERTCDDKLRIARCYYMFGDLLKTIAMYGNVENYLMKAITLQSNGFKEDYRTWIDDYGDSLESIAQYFFLMRKYSKVVKSCKESIAEIEGKDPLYPCLRNLYSILSATYGKLVELDESEKCARKALDIAIAFFGENAVEITKPLNALAVALKKQKKFSEAEDHYRQVLKLRKIHLGAYHLWVGHSLNNLGNLCAKRKQWQEAEEYYELSKEITVRVHGLHHPTISQQLYNVGRVYQKRGLKERALKYFGDAYLLALEFYDERHVLVTKIRNVIYTTLELSDKQIFNRFAMSIDLIRNFVLATGYGEISPQGTIVVKKRVIVNSHSVQINTPKAARLSRSYYVELHRRQKYGDEPEKPVRASLDSLLSMFSSTTEVLKNRVVFRGKEQQNDSSDEGKMECEPQIESSDEDMGFSFFDSD